MRIGLQGIEFVEFSSAAPGKLARLFHGFGFSSRYRVAGKAIDLFEQNGIRFLLSSEPGSYAWRFQQSHGPSISAMGWRFEDAHAAYELAMKRGAKPCLAPDYPFPAVYGIGDSLIYFVDEASLGAFWNDGPLAKKSAPEMVPAKGFLAIDHLTNNVYQGTMAHWARFYKDVFEFTEVRYFDIKGKKTGLQSYALRSPCGSFCIPINEAQEKKSQINEYLDEYHGPGIQHLAFLTEDILASLDALRGTSIRMLDIDPDYYRSVFERVPGVTEDHARIQDHQVLVDGDDKGYLLQIFTRNLVGPIFIEIIQRKNHLSFGEGNFQALFNSIERDQEKRGLFASA